METFIPPRRKKIGEIFIEMGVATEDDIRSALRFQQNNPQKRLGEILFDAGIIGPEDIAIALSKQFKMQYINLSKFILDEKLVHEIGEEKIAKLYFAPLKKFGDSYIIAIDDPTNKEKMEKIKESLTGQVNFVVASKVSLSKLLTEIVYKVETSKPTIKPSGPEEKSSPIYDLLETTEKKEEKQQVSFSIPKEPIKPEPEPEEKPSETFLTQIGDGNVFEQFLKKLKDLKVPVNIYLSTGITFQGGIIEAYDNESIYLKEKKKCQLVQRNAIVAMTFVEPLS